MRTLDKSEMKVVSGGDFITHSGNGNGNHSGNNFQNNAKSNAFPNQLIGQAVGNFGASITTTTVGASVTL
jgi:hypothetical protein